jgi:hypothetical protein
MAADRLVARRKRMQRCSETGIYSIGRQITAALETQRRAQYRPPAQMANHAQSRRHGSPYRGCRGYPVFGASLPMASSAALGQLVGDLRVLGRQAGVRWIARETVRFPERLGLCGAQRDFLTRVNRVNGSCRQGFGGFAHLIASGIG